jgi:hypothetical protein
VVDNHEKIQEGSFFASLKNGAANSKQANLQDQVNEQYKMSLKKSIVAKFAHKWLTTVQKRKAERENAKLRQM